MKRAKPKAKPLNKEPLDEWGIIAAEAGSVAGAHKFVSFVQRHLTDLGLFSSLPEGIQIRLRCLGSDARRLADFLDGYSEAQRP